LADRARAALAAVPGVEVLTPDNAAHRAGLVAFRVREMAGEAAAKDLGERGYLVRSIPGWNAVRASLHFFLREVEVDGLARAVAALAG
jgi:selenocysteine lyase/cysteine desulfurase